MDLAVDRLFFDPEHALRCAKERRPAEAWGRSAAVQLCYYTGRHQLPDVLDNLIFVPKSDFVAWMSASRLRAPREVAFPDPRPPGAIVQAFTAFFADAMRQVEARRLADMAHLRTVLAALPPDPPGATLRISAHTCRFTEVVQYSARGLVDAFRTLGHDAELVMEDDEREFWTWKDHMEEVLRRRPHLAIFLNHHHPDFLAPWMTQVVWWQDLMDSLTREGRLPWRDNDLVYSLHGRLFGPRLGARGLAAERRQVQHFCIDTGTYHPDPGVGRDERLAVFVGSALGPRLRELGGKVLPVLADLRQALAAHGPLDQDGVDAIAARHPGIDARDALDAWCYLVRDELVQALCRQHGRDGWRVEVYGHGWEHDPLVRPFHRGVVKPGAALADLYRRAGRAVCVHPLLVNHQRLAEVACCGCVPVVYDCRIAADPPFWEDQCAYFRDEAGLASALAQPVALEPQRFMDHFSYLNFARRILADAAPFLGEGIRR